jgi:hypothetical protein
MIQSSDLLKLCSIINTPASQLTGGVLCQTYRPSEQNYIDKLPGALPAIFSTP